jgi:drug/metabolite transporter (DMT)-like permease
MIRLGKRPGGRNSVKTWAYGLIALAAGLWGIISIFVKGLVANGFTPLEIVTVRMTLSAVLLTGYLAATNPAGLKIRLADSRYFIGTGILSVVFFNWCLFVAIKSTSVSIATILMYTAPAFVMILSAILFKERLTPVKIFSLLLTFAGCMLVTGVLQGSGQRASTLGILAGLGAGLGYALYSIFGKYALEKYDPMTIPVYTFMFAAIGLIPMTDYKGILHSFSNIEVIFYAAGLSLFSTVLPFTFYTKGLSKLESGRASLIATLEPVVASIVGFTVFKESVTFSKIIGIILVIAAQAIIREKPIQVESSADNCKISKENPM